MSGPAVSSLRLMMITAVPEVAARAADAGVDRVFVDLEQLGKRERQAHRDTFVSDHTIEDVTALRRVLPAGRLLVRINPWHDGSPAEVEEVIARGADDIMLPMFRTTAEVEALVRAVRGRAHIVPLMETQESLAIAGSLAGMEGIESVHIGLNDLHLALKKRFMFELLYDGTLDDAVSAFHRHGKAFGIGGLAKLDEGLLPASHILHEHVRLGSSAVILSRTFHRQARSLAELESHTDLFAEVARIRACFAQIQQESPAALESVRARSLEIVRGIAAAARPI